MRITLLSFMALVLLSACGQAVPSVMPSTTAENPTSTKSVPVLTLAPSKTPFPSKTAISTAKEWIKVYPTKKTLVVYGTSWRNEYTMQFIEWGDFYIEPYFVLYEDGLLIFGTGGHEKHLSQKESEDMLTKLEQLGFFRIQDTYAADPQNSLYSFPTGVTPVPDLNLPAVVLTVGGQEVKTIRYMKEWERYLIQPMKDIISYLNSISSDGAMRYQPDRLLIAFVSEEAKRIPKDAVIIPWPEDVTSPAHRSYMGVLYLEGAEALKLYKAAGENLYEYFSFEGKKYNVYLRPILPHECHIYHLHAAPPPAQPYFTCDDW